MGGVLRLSECEPARLWFSACKSSVPRSNLLEQPSSMCLVVYSLVPCFEVCRATVAWIGHTFVECLCAQSAARSNHSDDGVPWCARFGGVFASRSCGQTFYRSP